MNVCLSMSIATSIQGSCTQGPWMQWAELFLLMWKEELHEYMVNHDHHHGDDLLVVTLEKLARQGNGPEHPGTGGPGPGGPGHRTTSDQTTKDHQGTSRQPCQALEKKTCIQRDTPLRPSCATLI